MQANPSLILPAKFPISPTHLPQLHRILSPARLKPPRVISISAPADVSPPRVPFQHTDEQTAAFWDYQFLWVSQRSETADPITLRLVDGAVPPDFPSGTYYLTGPGLFTDDHGSTVHPLDGHGYLRSFSVDGDNGNVKFMAKYVKTEAQVEEHDVETDTWRFTYRGPFSVLKAGQKLGNTKVMKNVANTSVLKWGGKLLSMWEGGIPYEIESETLDTVGRFDMIDGRDLVMDGENKDGGDFWDFAASLLKPMLYEVFKMSPKRLLSHYKLDPKRGRLLTMSCNAEDMLLPRSHFTFYEYDKDFKLVQTREFNIPDHMMIHDWAFTDTHYIISANRIKLDIMGSIGAVCGMSPMISALSVNPSKSTSPMYLLPRFPDKSSGSRDWRVPIEVPSQMWLLHVGNAFDTIDDNGNLEIQIHACACSYQWFNFQKMFGYDWQSGRLDPSMMNKREGEDKLLPHLVEISINLDADGSKKCSVEPLNQWIKPADFPIINPSFSGNKNTYVYAATSSGSRRTLPHFPFDTVVKMNLSNMSTQTWSVGARRFIGEPIFVAKQGLEDDGYLLVVEYAVAIQTCYLVILNPKRIGEADALVARLEVPKNFNFPLGFHGFWASHDLGGSVNRVAGELRELVKN